MSILRGTYCYFDTETTGHDPWDDDDRVVQAAVIQVRDGQIIGTIDLLLDPGRPIPAEVIPIHGITDEMVVGQPAFSSTVAALLAMFRTSWVVIHNAPFDLAFLDQAMVEAGIPPEELRIVDTLEIARMHCNYPGNAMRKIAQYYQVDTPEPHQALTDVLILKSVTEHMLRDLEVDSPAALEKLQGVYVREVGLSPVIPPFWAQAIDAGREVRIFYLSSSGRRERMIVPRRFYRRYGQQYLAAHCFLAEKELTFRVDRIELPEDL